jgi:hypothetical protein
MRAAELPLPGATLSQLTGARAQEDPEKRADRLERLIQELGGDPPEEREGAIGEIRKLGPGALPRLRQSLQVSEDTEVRGRVYATAPNALTLEAYYRYPVVGRKK